MSISISRRMSAFFVSAVGGNGPGGCLRRDAHPEVYPYAHAAAELAGLACAAPQAQILAADTLRSLAKLRSCPWTSGARYVKKTGTPRPVAPIHGMARSPVGAMGGKPLMGV